MQALPRARFGVSSSRQLFLFHLSAKNLQTRMQKFFSTYVYYAGRLNTNFTQKVLATKSILHTHDKRIRQNNNCETKLIRASRMTHAFGRQVALIINCGRHLDCLGTEWAVNILCGIVIVLNRLNVVSGAKCSSEIQWDVKGTREDNSVSPAPVYEKTWYLAHGNAKIYEM